MICVIECRIRTFVAPVNLPAGKRVQCTELIPSFPLIRSRRPESSTRTHPVVPAEAGIQYNQTMNLDSAILYSDDLERITNFYVNEIGLEVEYRDKDQFVSFKFPNGARLGINKPENALRDRDLPGHQTVFIRVDDVKQRSEEMIAKGYELFEPYADEDWGEFFAILDPDGNKIGFIKSRHD